MSLIEQTRELTALLATFYLALAFTAIGIGLMVAGPRGAGAAGRLFFVAPLRWASVALRVLMIGLVIGFIRLMVRLVTGSWRMLVTHILRPAFDELRFWARWLVSR